MIGIAALVRARAVLLNDLRVTRLQRLARIGGSGAGGNGGSSIRRSRCLLGGLLVLVVVFEGGRSA